MGILPGPTPTHPFVNLGGSRAQIQYHGVSGMHLLLSTPLSPYLTLLQPDTSPEDKNCIFYFRITRCLPEAQGHLV